MWQIVEIPAFIIAVIATVGLWLSIMVHKVSWKLAKFYPKKAGLKDYLNCSYCSTLPLAFLVSLIIIDMPDNIGFKFWLSFILFVLAVETVAGIILHYFRRNGWYETHYETIERKEAEKRQMS